MSSRSVFALCFLSMLGFLTMLSGHHESEAAEPAASGKVLRHVVMYKFKEGVTPAQLQEVIDAFAGLPKKIDTIVAFEHGPNVSKEGKSEGFTHVFVVTFRNEKGLADYLVHPAHEAYVKVVRDRREKVVVFDYWADE
jgi:hypothetical protein